MSVYQKFIDSASKNHQQVVQCNRMSDFPATILSKQKLKFPSTLNSTITSTPINKHQYKRLVEAEHYAMSQQHYNCHSSKQHFSTSTCACCHHQQAQHAKKQPIESMLNTDDPILLNWLRAMRFETELECLTSLQARTLAIDEYSAGALSVRNSQVYIQEMRLESNFTLDYIDYLIDSLPICLNRIARFSVEFSELWRRLINQTAAQTTAQSTTIINNNTTIINCTPRKSAANVRASRPLDKLALQIRNLCSSFASLLYEYQDNNSTANNSSADYSLGVNNGEIESALRKLKELYGKFVEISIRAECANIIRALDYDFSQSSLNRLSSSSSLVHPVKPFESSSSQLPLKWALIALWQLTKDDSYICRTLTEKWQQTTLSETRSSPSRSRVAKRLDYSTKYDQQGAQKSQSSASSSDDAQSLRSDYQKLYQICQREHGSKFKETNDENRASGALNNALRRKEQQQPINKQVSTIELLIDVIISQPNKHERLDMMNFMHHQSKLDKLVDFEEWDQSVSAAIYTSNQYKVAALRILNHLCINEQAVKTILKCFSTPPSKQGQPLPENKIIRSIFECYQTSQEHIYQNETMFNNVPANNGSSSQRGRKRAHHHVQQVEDEEYSDYGSRQTNSLIQEQESADESEDVVVKEAIRLLIQLTTSFHRSNQGLDFYNLIGRFSTDSLVKYLTNIIKSSTSREMLFLSLTALANISFITTEPMKYYGTNRIMLEMFRTSKNRSKDLELRDQAVTILANTADKNLLDIVSNGGLTFLLSCLENCPTRMANYKQLKGRPIDCRDFLESASEDGGYCRLNIENKPRDRKPIDLREDFPDFLQCACDEQQQTSSLSRMSPVSSSSPIFKPAQTTNHCLSKLTSNQLAALERIHQKTAVAFARMSSDSSTTRMVLNHGGIKQMIDMCKFSYKRNHSDTVLIACIAALRKMAKVIEANTFKYYNALDLIELELNQALEIYGNTRDQSQRLFASDV